MKADWTFWLFLFVLVVLHFVLHLSLGIGVYAPDLVVLALLLAARQLTGGMAAGTGFVLGLLEDAVSLAAFGASVIANTVVGYLGARSRDLFVGDSVLFLGLYLFLGAWVQDALYYVVAPSVRRGEPVEALLMHAPLQAAYVAAAGIVAIVIYRAVRR